MPRWADGERTRLETAVLRILDAAEFDKRFQAALAERQRVQFLNLPLNTVAQARAARTAGRMRLEDHVVLADYYASSQQWDRVNEHLRDLQRLATDQTGIWHLRNVVLQMSRNHEELRKRLLDAADRLAAAAAQDELFLAKRILDTAQAVASGQESLQLLDRLQPLYERQPAHTLALKFWMVRRAAILIGLGRTDEGLELRRQTALVLGNMSGVDPTRVGVWGVSYGGLSMLLQYM